jgi:hypothetical protein
MRKLVLLGVLFASSTFAATIRGSGIQVADASSYVVSWPAGTVSGDLALVSCSQAFGCNNTPSGWTQIYYSGIPIDTAGAIYSKVLNSTDISAGSVTITAGGTYYGQVSIVTFVGAPTVREADGDGPPGSSGTSSTISTTSAVRYGDLALYFGSGRADSANPTCTVNVGAQIQAATDLSWCGCVYTQTVGGPATAIFNFSTTVFYVDAIVIIEGSGKTPRAYLR